MLHVLKCPNDLNEYYTLRTRDWNGILRRATLLSPREKPRTSYYQSFLYISSGPLSVFSGAFFNRQTKSTYISLNFSIL